MIGSASRRLPRAIVMPMDPRLRWRAQAPVGVPVPADGCAAFGSARGSGRRVSSNGARCAWSKPHNTCHLPPRSPRLQGRCSPRPCASHPKRGTHGGPRPVTMRAGSRRSGWQAAHGGNGARSGRAPRPGPRRSTDRPPTGTADSDERYLLSAGGTTVKIRDGLMDVKALLAVDAQRAPAVAARPQGRLPDRRRRGSRGVGGAAAPGARPRARDLHGGAARGRADRAGHRRARRRGPQAPGALRDRRLHLGAHRRHRRRPDHADDRGRDGGSGAGDRGRRGRWASPTTSTPRTRRVSPRCSTACRRGTRSSTPARTRSSSTWRNGTATDSGRWSTAPSSPAWARGWRRAAW